MAETTRPATLWREPALTGAEAAASYPVRWSEHFDEVTATYTLQEGAPNNRAASVWDEAAGAYVLQPSVSGDAPEIMLAKSGNVIHEIIPAA